MNIIPIIYENENIYIIHKPPGLATQGGQGVVHSVDTVFAKQVGKKIYLVHRLDKDTEGLLIVAKNSAAACEWTELVSGKDIQKEYYALCIGDIEKKTGQITEPIIQKGVSKVATTYFSVEQTFSCTYEYENTCQTQLLSLVRLKIATGRMHQIRIHLAKIGIPIAGDDKHGNFKNNKLVKKYFGIKKLQLIAFKLSIPTKYIKNETNTSLTEFSIPLPNSFTLTKDATSSL